MEVNFETEIALLDKALNIENKLLILAYYQSIKTKLIANLFSINEDENTLIKYNKFLTDSFKIVLEDVLKLNQKITPQNFLLYYLDFISNEDNNFQIQIINDFEKQLIDSDYKFDEDMISNLDILKLNFKDKADLIIKLKKYLNSLFELLYTVYGQNAKILIDNIQELLKIIEVK